MSVNYRVNRTSEAARREQMSSPAMAQVVPAARRGGGSGTYPVYGCTISTHITFGTVEEPLNLDAEGDAVDEGGGVVSVPVAGHDEFDTSGGEQIIISGTANFDGEHTTTSDTTADKVAFTHAFSVEEFDGTETIKLKDELNLDAGGDAVDEGGGVVSVPVAGHNRFDTSGGEEIVIAGTTYFDGVQTTTSDTTADKVAFTHAFSIEGFSGSETIKLKAIEPVKTYKGIIGIVEKYNAATSYTQGMKCWVANPVNEYEADFYTCILESLNHEPPEATYWKVTAEVDLHIMGTQINGDDTDHRKYIPWFPEGTMIPVVKSRGKWFISWAMIFTDNKSVSWIENSAGECAGRIGAIFR